MREDSNEGWEVMWDVKLEGQASRRRGNGELETGRVQ